MAGATAVQAEVESMIKSCILSSKETLTIRSLNEQYYEIIGEKIPHQKLGFSSLYYLLANIPGISLTQVHNDVIVEATSEKSSHIASLVSRQRDKGPKGRRFRGLLVAPTGWRNKDNKILYRSPCKEPVKKKSQWPSSNKKNSSFRASSGHHQKRDSNSHVGLAERLSRLSISPNAPACLDLGYGLGNRAKTRVAAVTKSLDAAHVPSPLPAWARPTLDSVKPASVTPMPVKPASVTPKPVKPASVTPIPVKPALVTPKPVKPSRVKISPIRPPQGPEKAERCKSAEQPPLRTSLPRHVQYSPRKARLEVVVRHPSSPPPESPCTCRPGVQCAACTEQEEEAEAAGKCRVRYGGPGKLQVEIPVRMNHVPQAKVCPPSGPGSPYGSQRVAYRLARGPPSPDYLPHLSSRFMDEQEWEDGPFLLDHQLVGDDFLLQFADKALYAECSWLCGQRLACGTCVSGQTIRQCLETFLCAPIICPNLVLMLGAADILHGHLLSRMCDDLWELVGALLPVTESLVLLTLPFFPCPNSDLNRSVVAFNHFIKSLTTMTKVHVLDVHPLFSYNSLPDRLCFERVVRPIVCYPRGVVLWSPTGRRALFHFLYSALYEVSPTPFW